MRKRSTFWPVFLMLIVIGASLGALWWFNSSQADRFALQKRIQNIFAFAFDSNDEQTSSRSSRTKAEISVPAPEPMMIAGEPSWLHLEGKHRYLEPDADLSFQHARQQQIRLDKLSAIEAGRDGRIYALHQSHLRVHVFSKDLQPLQSWPLEMEPDEFMSRPVAFSARGDRLVVASEEGVVGFWRLDGQFVSSFRFPGKLRDVDVYPNGDLVLVTPGQPHLLHRVSPSGRSLLAFAYRDSSASPTARVFDSAIVAVLPDESVALSYESAYHLEFYHRDGRPVASLMHPMTLSLSPPEIERDESGRIKRVFRQIVSYDLKVDPQGLLYHLVRLRGAEGGDQWDVFSSNGEYLQRFYLPYNQKGICFANGAVYVLGAYPKTKLEKYFILTLTEASQLGPEWRERIEGK